MKQRTAFIALVLGGAALFGCSKGYPLAAVFIDGKLAFTSDHKPPEHAPYCVAWFTVAEEGGRIMWKFDAYEAQNDAEHCPNFPLFYGQAPKGAKIEVPPQALVPGHRYFVSATAGDSYDGAFIYSTKMVREVRNLDIHDDEVRGAFAQAIDENLEDEHISENVSNDR